MTAPTIRSGVAVGIEGLSCSYGSDEVLHGIDLEVVPGETVSLLGPSGCGKTTLLRCIAGLERPGRGRVLLDDEIVSAPGRWVEPRRRGVGMVFQDGALFPHLSVADNIGFGLGSRAARRAEGRRRIADLLALVGLPDMGDRSPSTLSGGQRQRVALARALAPTPSVLLLDEPFSALDASLREQVRSDVEDILEEVGVTVVFVTHDQEEAFEIGDRVAVMRDGRIEQVAPTRDLYRRPASPWVASFVGDANLLPAMASGSTARTVLGDVVLAEPADGAVVVCVRPEDIAVASPGGPAIAGSAPVSASVCTIRYRGHDTIVVARLDDGTEVQVRLQGDPPSGPTVGLCVGGPPVAHWSTPDPVPTPGDGTPPQI